MVKLRVDRYLLLEIASDKALVEALAETTFSVITTNHTHVVLDRLLERIFSLIPAERGAVLFSNRKTNNLECAAFRGASPSVDPDVVAEALSEYTAIASDENDRTSLLCAPLRAFDM